MRYCSILYLGRGRVSKCQCYSDIISTLFQYRDQKAQVGNAQEIAQSERNSHSINRGVGKN